MLGLQPAGRLRGVLVERGTNEASVRVGSVRCVLGLHPGRQILSALAQRGRRPLGPGQSLPEPASPPLCSPDSKRHARTLRGGERNVRAWLFQITRIAQPSETVIGISGWITDERLERKKKILKDSYRTLDSVFITLLTFSIRTAKQKQLMGGASRRGASRLVVASKSTRPLPLFYWWRRIRPLVHLVAHTSTCMKAAYLVKIK